jgi:hypothetical protein
MSYKLSLTFVGALSLAATGVLAQTAPGDPSRPSDAPNGRTRGGAAADGSNLSDKLDAGGGVIKPESGVDPEIVKPAPVPHPNSTPVIPPPGMPGGPPGPEPK